ncbi:MAG TPA: hypothetical protein EYQ84_07980 [Nitrospinaceae bacterium]|nr:hypothetical protein [Nitrospinaceae bacterium]
MAHLGQIDRRNPGDVVFTRYVTKNPDWNKLKIRIENGQFAEMFEDKNNELESMDINIHPRTEIKLVSNEYKEFEKKKYANIEYQRKKGYVLISKIRKPTDDLGAERPQKLQILAEDFTEKGKDEKITVLTKKDVPVKLFETFDELKKSVIWGLNNRIHDNDYVIEKIKSYLDKDDLSEIDLNGIDDSHIDELGVYFGEILIGILAFKNQLSDTCTPSDMFGINLKSFSIPTDPAFKLVDSSLTFDTTTVSVSSKYDKGAAASFMSNILPYGMKKHLTYKNCFFKKMCMVASKMGYTSKQVGANRFKFSKNITFEVGLREVLKIKKAIVKNTNHSLYDSIRKVAMGQELTQKENQELDEVIEAIEDYFIKKKTFDGGEQVILTIRNNYPFTITSFFNYSVASNLNNDPLSKKYVSDIIGGKDFYQANLSKTKWRKGIIDIKMVSPKSASLKILGSMSGATDFTAKQGLVNYELK